jgi:mandelate racemase
MLYRSNQTEGGQMCANKVISVKARAVLAPIKTPPVTASGSIKNSALVLIDLQSDAGLTGRSYLFAFSENMLKPTVDCVEAIENLVIGLDADPFSLDRILRAKLRLYDTHGILGQVLSGLDMAIWDIYSQSKNQPLAKVLGGSLDPVPAYNSCGLWIKSIPELLAEIPMLLEDQGFSATKIRIGRPDPADDLIAVRALRKEIPDQISLMSDFNQSATDDPTLRCRMLDGEGLYWIEEPVLFDDFKSCASLRRELETPIQLGENLRSQFEMTAALDADCSDFYMLDVQRIGGVTGWLAASKLASPSKTPLSSHLFPEMSVHLLAASPTRHWLEYVDWANPILEEPLSIIRGHAVVPDRPGNGIRWDERAVSLYEL